MINASQVRTGMALKYEGQPYRVVAADYHPGQGKMGGVLHARLQNLATGTFWEHSFRAELKLEDMPVERQSLEYLYSAGDQCCFMNPDTYEQTEIPRDLIGAQADFLQEGAKLSVDFVDGRPVNVSLPEILEVRIAATAPAMHQQQDSTFKPATLDNGVEIMVPQFVKIGDTIRLDMQTRKYMDRVKTDAKAKGA